MPNAKKTYTVVGLWIDDEPVAAGYLEGIHDVRGGASAQAYDEGGPWAEQVEVDDGQDPEAVAIELMLSTLPQEPDPAAVKDMPNAPAR